MNPHIVQLSRDPFARGDLVRKTEPAGAQACRWCGQVRKSGRLFRYGWWSDGGRLSWDSRPFCSVGCRNTYYS
jgi:hypothetical protein